MSSINEQVLQRVIDALYKFKPSAEQLFSILRRYHQTGMNKELPIEIRPVDIYEDSTSLEDTLVPCNPGDEECYVITHVPSPNNGQVDRRTGYGKWKAENGREKIAGGWKMTLNFYPDSTPKESTRRMVEYALDDVPNMAVCIISKTKTTRLGSPLGSSSRDTFRLL